MCSALPKLAKRVQISIKKLAVGCCCSCTNRCITKLPPLISVSGVAPKMEFQNKMGGTSGAFLPQPCVSVWIATVILLKRSIAMIVGGGGGPGLAKY